MNLYVNARQELLISIVVLSLNNYYIVRIINMQILVNVFLNANLGHDDFQMEQNTIDNKSRLSLQTILRQMNISEFNQLLYSYMRKLLTW